jgi:hypothetical protein
MVIIGMMSYPSESANEVGKRFLAQKPLVNYITMKGPFISSKQEEGIQTITIYECERSKLPDAFEAIGNRYAAYIGAPGYTYSIQVWYEATEALKMIGLA